MARRGKNQARRSGSRGTPGWVWLLAGLGIGLAVAVGYYLHQGGKVDDLLPRPNPTAEAVPESEPPVAQTAPRKPKYDFYTVLPEKEVVIPDSELSAEAQREAAAAQAAAANATPTTASTTDAGVRYLIQAGAFRSAGDAEALKARIALTGQVARVESGDSHGAPIHRVRLGPFASASELARAKQTLADNGIEAQAIKAQ
ncbi:MAG TPA: SPOR domain-containing protein [Arenimonas sp.]|nr:SPOR domain-containing protein [Arenimonas sp.]